MRSSATIERGNTMNATKIEQTATLELTAHQWRIIIIALNEAQTMPRASMTLAAEIDELTAVQF
jgi:hypothetical protein